LGGAGSTTSNIGGNGEDTIVDAFIAKGGGGGGAYGGDRNGQPGGSGGGASGYSGVGGANDDSQDPPGYGHDGGDFGGTHAGAGGGGAVEEGYDGIGATNTGGAGGDGLDLSGMYGTARGDSGWFGGGGGGSGYQYDTAAAGGQGGGGVGGLRGTSPGSGMANTGGGGGGRERNGTAGNGGSGVVIVGEPVTLTSVRTSLATSLGHYGSTNPDLKIKWKSFGSCTVETGISDSDSVDPSTWYEQTNGASITDLPADLTGKYLYTRIVLGSASSLEWLVVYDNADDPYAAVRIDFNGEIKAVPSTGTVDFENVDPAADIPYTVYVLGLNDPGPYGYENIWPDGFDDTVTVVDADVTENVTLVIPAARVTQFYMEVAIGEDLLALPAARVTYFYIEVASPHWEYDITSNSMRIGPKLSAPLFGLDLPVEALSMRIGPVLPEAPLYVAYVLDAEGLRLLQRISEARINTQGLCIFYSFVGELCILETVETKHSINEELELDEGIYVETSVYEPFIMQAEVVWPRQLIYS
jgi:hypothetical protein